MNEVKTMQDCIRECREKHQEMKDQHIWEQIWQRNQRRALEHQIDIFDSHSEEITVSMHGFPKPPERLEPFHRHNFFELIYVYHGCFVNEFQNEKITLQEGDILLLNPMVLHRVHTLKDDDYVFNIKIPPSLFQQKILPLLIGNPLFYFFFMETLYQTLPMERYLFFQNSHTDLIHQSVQTIIQEFFSQESSFHSMIEAQLIYLCGLLSRQQKLPPVQGQNNSQEQLVFDAIALINQNQQQVTLGNIAGKMGYSKEHLSRIIKKVTGKSFSKLLQECRMNTAALYLQTSPIPISQVMEKIGLHDLSYFYVQFKALYGVTPAQYRKLKKGQD
ncbi:MAG: AraC family transcriptional regulator [Clostridiales bacterium]|nr:AraC family transcriptional regulator [Clostridiales bacterium]